MKHLTVSLLNILSFTTGCSVCMALLGKETGAGWGFVGCFFLLVASIFSELANEIR